MIRLTYEPSFHMDEFTIRQAKPQDAPLLAAVERSAAQAFLQLPGLAWLASSDTQSVEQHLNFIKLGLEWVAIDDENVPIAFLNGKLENNNKNFHINEVSVESTHQGKGIGRSLVLTAKQWAITSGCLSITLTTFRNVPWNEGFYRSMQFRTLDSFELTPSLEALMKSEDDAGLAFKERCAMCLRLV